MVVPHKHMYTLRRSERTKRIQFWSSINHFFLSAYVFAAALFVYRNCDFNDFFFSSLLNFHISSFLFCLLDIQHFAQWMPWNRIKKKCEKKKKLFPYYYNVANIWSTPNLVMSQPNEFHENLSFSTYVLVFARFFLIWTKHHGYSICWQCDFFVMQTFFFLLSINFTRSYQNAEVVRKWLWKLFACLVLFLWI